VLVLVHPERSAMPRGTRRWLDSVPVQQHLHVPWAGNEGFNRLARTLSGNAVAVVLGGGGARGFAHVGVVRALREAGVPIDAVGGTSFGAIVAGAVAMGWGDEKMLDRFKVAFVDERPTNDYTLPIMSVLRGEKMTRGLRRHFGDALIEDLSIPFFAVSSNLSRSRVQVHKGGPLWRALRGSVSLPAIFAPLIEDGDLLVDGGILNNLPVDLMRESVRGRTIAVDLSVKDDFRYEREALPSAWEYLKGRLSPSASRLAIPTIGRVVLKSTMLGSRREVEAAKREADLFLNPPVSSFDLLGWARFHDIVEVAYRYARGHLAGWIEDHPEVVQHEETFDSRRLRAAREDGPEAGDPA
jgi:predicted acylesterase/phospholipase RssA